MDERLATNVPGIYALGDINGGPAFTHISYDDFRIVRDNLLEGKDASTTGRLVPYVVYIDPQLGRVGLTEAEARKQGHEVKVATMPMSSVARARETDETRGVMKVVVDAQSEQILGAAILGIEGGELMSMLQIAMMGKLPYTALRDGVFAHPALSESFNNLFATIESLNRIRNDTPCVRYPHHRSSTCWRASSPGASPTGRPASPATAMEPGTRPTLLTTGTTRTGPTGTPPTSPRRTWPRSSAISTSTTPSRPVPRAHPDDSPDEEA